MFAYHYTMTPDDNNTLLIEFPDVPEAAAVADTESDALEQAADGLEAALQMYVEARRPLPAVVFTDGPAVTLSASVVIKLLISDEMVRQGMRKADMARAMRLHPPQIDRLLDLCHCTKIDTLEAALAVMGRRLAVSII